MPTDRVGHGRRAAEREALLRWAKLKSNLLDHSYFTKFVRVAEGAEHVVYHDQANGLAIKATHPNRFGHSVSAIGGYALPLEYLQRLAWHNQLFGDRIRIEGLIESDDSMEIVTSQPWIVSRQLPSKAAQDQIDLYFKNLGFGFQRVEINPGVPLFYSPDLGVIVADAHSGNILLTDRNDLVPIDLVIGVPGPKLLAEIAKLLN